MHLKIFLFILACLCFTEQSFAWCLVGCDSTSRNISTDYGKIVNKYKKKGFNVNKSRNDTKTMCHINSKNELEILFVSKNVEEGVLVVAGSRYSPPKKVGSSDWDRINVNVLDVISVQNTLNFGLLGIKNNLSEDMRCYGGLWSDLADIDQALIVCVYNEDEELPIAKSRAKKELIRTEAYKIFRSAAMCK